MAWHNPHATLFPTSNESMSTLPTLNASTGCGTCTSADAAAPPYMNLISPSRTNPATFPHLSIYFPFYGSTSISILSASASQQGHLGNYALFFYFQISNCERRKHVWCNKLEKRFLKPTIFWPCQHPCTKPEKPDKPVLSCGYSSGTKGNEYLKSQLKARQLPSKKLV